MTITDPMPTTKTIAPVHPGEILLEEFLEPLGLSANALAVHLGVPAPRIYDIIKGKRAITADTALRLAKYFDTTEQFWANLQSRYDLEITKDQIEEDLAYIRPRDGGTAFEIESAPVEIQGGYECGSFNLGTGVSPHGVGDFGQARLFATGVHLSTCVGEPSTEGSENDYSYAMAS